MIELKTCTKCDRELPLTEFYHHKRTRDGLYGYCKACKYAQHREWMSKNPERVKSLDKKWRMANPEKLKKMNKRWADNNPERAKNSARIRGARQRKTTRGRLRNSINSGINKSIRSGAKAGRHWETLVGCTVNELKIHIEKQFQSGMAWENYGEWHIDHKIPISVFNYETPDNPDFKRCWSLKNLRPMWAEENMSKSNKIDFPFQPSLALRLSA